VKHLFIVRHAQAQFNASGRDIDRPLSPSGARDAMRMATLTSSDLSGAGAGADVGAGAPVFSCSPAVRTRQTAGLFLETWSRSAVQLQLFDRGYATTPAAWLAHIQSWPNTAEQGWIWGHNPELSMLVNELAGSDTSVELSPADIICLAFDINDWGAVFSASGTITRHYIASQHSQ